MKRTLVFDIDDTICTHTNRDYANARPHWDVIGKINQLSKQGYYIKLYTARGQNSCNGNLELILERNESILIEWLDKYCVKYDELIFGKPLGNWYIDDKAMTVESFVDAPFEELIGNSGASIYHEHDKVIKKGEKVKKEYEWYNIVNNMNFDSFKIPRIYSFTVDTLIMDFIDGPMLTNVVQNNHLKDLVIMCMTFKHIKNGYSFSVEKYVNYLYECLPNKPYVRLISEELMKYKALLQDSASFCHGDLTLNNIIRKKIGYYLIDPGPKDDYSSYLLDLAKIRYSLSGYDNMFGFTLIDRDYLPQRIYYDRLLNAYGLLEIVKLLEITRWIRIIPFVTKLHPEKVQSVLEKIIELWREYNEE